MFEIIRACLLGALFLCIGLYVGQKKEQANQAKEESKEETVTLVAVVNMDEGTTVDGESINYGLELSEALDENYASAALEDAKAGIYNGTYGGYIIIPPTFSSSVESINDFPNKASLTYAINPNLNDETKLKVTNHITDYMKQMNDTLSYVYVTSIMEEFHDVQDGSKIILEHDIEDLNNILAIKPELLTQTVEYTPLERPEYKWENMDLTPYYDKNDGYVEEMDKYYTGVNEELKKKTAEVTEKTKGISGEYAQIKKDIDEFNPLKKENGEDVCEEGFTKLETESVRTDDESMRTAVNTKMTDEILIDRGFYRNKLNEYVNEQLEDYIEEQQEAMENWYSNPMHTGSDYELEDLEIDLSEFEATMDDIETEYPLLGKEDSELTESEITEKQNLIENLKKNQSLSTRCKQNIYELIVPTRAAITQILKEDVVDVAKENMKSGLEEVEEKLNKQSEDMSQVSNELSTFDPLKETDQSGAKESLGKIRSNITELQRIVNEKTLNDSEKVSEIYLANEKNVTELQNSIKEASDKTKSNVEQTIDTLKAAREGLNTENNEILSAFSNRLSYRTA